MNPTTSIYSCRFAMYDYARGNCAREEFLRDLLDRTAEMNLTGLAVYIEDLALFVAPRLFRGSIHLDGWRRLDEHARGKGLLLLPLLNLYGHCEQTLAHPRFASLADDPCRTTLDYGRPSAKALVQRSLDVVVETFRCPYLHVGFDEVWSLGCRQERRTGRPVHVPSTFARNLIWISEQVRRRGRRPMFWGDVPGVYYPEIIPDLPRDLIPVDWFYRVEPDYPSMRRWTEHGFTLWVGPTIGYSGVAMPDFAGEARHAGRVIAAGRAAGAEGIIFTFWEHNHIPYRARLPMLYWQNQLATGRARGRASMPRAMTKYVRPRLGSNAATFVKTAIALGSVPPLLPHELCEHTRDLAALRWTWYRNDPSARRAVEDARRILRRTRRAARSVPELRFAHRLLALLADALDPERVDGRRLAREVRAIEPWIRRGWIRERTVESYRLRSGPAFARFARQFERWPEHLNGTAPPYSPEALYATRGVCPTEPSLDGLRTRAGEREQEPTRLFAWHDRRALHLRFECVQARPARGVEQSVDFLLTRDDLVAVCLDVWGERAGCLWIEGNPSGTTFCQVHDRHNANSEWHRLAGRKDWGRAVKVAGGWGIEFRLPFAELGIRPPRPGFEMGLTIERRHAWGTAPIARWGGSRRASREHPSALSPLFLL
jgi:hypothetical protein